MIRQLKQSDVTAVASIHKDELHGFLPQLGIDFLQKFYNQSIFIPGMFTFVFVKDDHILGFVTGVTDTKGLYKQILTRDLLGFGFIFMKFFIFHFGQWVKLVQTLYYPGFSQSEPELLTIAVRNMSQGKGIGRQLFEKTVKEFKKRGIKSFDISVYDRLAAVQFYNKIGCRKVHTFDFLGEKMSYFRFLSA